MKAYKIYVQDRMGYEDDIFYAKTYDKAVQLFNNEIRKELKNAGDDAVDKVDFGEEISSFHEYNEDREIICRKCPILIHQKKDSKRLHRVANVPRWEKTSYEYNEYEIISDSVVLEEIEILE